MTATGLSRPALVGSGGGGGGSKDGSARSSGSGAAAPAASASTSATAAAAAAPAARSANVFHALSGGVAGAVAKTCTAPLARLVILYQVRGGRVPW